MSPPVGLELGCEAPIFAEKEADRSESSYCILVACCFSNYVAINGGEKEIARSQSSILLACAGPESRSPAGLVSIIAHRYILESGIERPNLRNAWSIANMNALIYVLINLRVYHRIRQRRIELGL